MSNNNKYNLVDIALENARYNKNPELFIDLINQYKNENWIGIGGQRAAFKRKNFIVKVPMCWGGIEDNQSEARQYRELKKTGYIPFAACRMAGDYLLVMEYVADIDLAQHYPEWVKSVDCRQVGLDRKGKLVAYDYSDRWS